MGKFGVSSSELRATTLALSAVHESDNSELETRNSKLFFPLAAE